VASVTGQGGGHAQWNDRIVAEHPLQRAGWGLLLLVLLPSGVAGQRAGRLPFFVGEEFRYRIQVARVGTVGVGTLRVADTALLRGDEAYLLRFDVETRVLGIGAVDRTAAWLDPARMAAVRFHKHERHPLSRHDERVEIFPAQQRWEDATGRGGATLSDAPLDELSFLYFVRTLPLSPGTVHRLDRHFRAERNPVTVRVLGRESVHVGAGSFAAVLVEMRVRDARRYGGGEGAIRIHLSDDPCRLPLRIESSMRGMGTTVLALEAHSHPPGHGATLSP
jgi:hypothetical protein